MWLRCRENYVRWCLDRVMEKLVLFHAGRAKVIQRCYRASVDRYRNACATRIQTAPRMLLARQQIVARQTMEFIRLYEALKRCGTPTSCFVPSSSSCIVSKQLVDARFLNLRCLVNQLNHAYDCRATTIQARSRGILARAYATRLRPAREYLETEIPPLAKTYGRKLRRKRVLVSSLWLGRLCLDSHTW